MLKKPTWTDKKERTNLVTQPSDQFAEGTVLYKKKIKYTQKNRKTRLENFKKMYNKNYLLQLDFD